MMPGFPGRRAMRAPLFNLVLCLVLPASAVAQTMSVRGQITDQSGTLVPGVTVTLIGPDGASRVAPGAGDGTYAFPNLPVAAYTLNASAPGLVLLQPIKIPAKAGPQIVNLLLNVASEKQQVTVEENAAPAVSTDAAANVSAIPDSASLIGSGPLPRGMLAPMAKVGGLGALDLTSAAAKTVLFVVDTGRGRLGRRVLDAQHRRVHQRRQLRSD
jgi:hypothetical protein